MVIENFYSKGVPLCGVLGGGYNKSFERLILLHSMLHKIAQNIFSGLGFRDLNLGLNQDLN